jgi:hypothetical protein
MSKSIALIDPAAACNEDSKLWLLMFKVWLLDVDSGSKRASSKWETIFPPAGVRS